MTSNPNPTVIWKESLAWWASVLGLGVMVVFAFFGGLKELVRIWGTIPERAELLAVGSRSAETGNTFGDKYSIPRRYIGYKDVAADLDVEIVYIGTPGVFHHHDVSMCLEAGKHVLCEKAFTVNATEAEDLIRLSRQKDRFLMEAMWTRFFPIHVKIRELLAEKVIGDVNGMVVNFMAKPPFDLSNRFFDLRLGAGVLMDTGSYGISWAYSLLGKPQQVTGLAYFGETPRRCRRRKAASAPDLLHRSPMQRRTFALHSAAAAAALALHIRGRSQALEKPRTTIAVGGNSLLQGRAPQIVLGVNPKTMAGIRVLTGFGAAARRAGWAHRAAADEVAAAGG